MRRRHVHDEHLNHEAWAIPYGDLVTLLLAFFVVMYAISSVNEGKYRQVSDSLHAAFSGKPDVAARKPMIATPAQGAASLRASPIALPSRPADASAARKRGERELQSLGDRIGDALSSLVRQRLVRVRRGQDYLEVEIQSDMLFDSGSAAPSALAVETVHALGTVLRDAPNAIRVEGYTDDQPIATTLFASNWELSAARAASVLHELAAAGVAPVRLSMVGFGEFQPVADNATAAGRGANRRVMLVILAAPLAPDALTRAMPAANAQASTGDAHGVALKPVSRAG